MALIGVKRESHAFFSDGFLGDGLFRGLLDCDFLDCALLNCLSLHFCFFLSFSKERAYSISYFLQKSMFYVKNFAIISRMDNSEKKHLYRMTTLIVSIVLFVGGLLLATPNYLRARSLKRQDTELKLQIAQKKREIARLTEMQKRFRSDADFVERIARQNRRVFPGELVFAFED